MHPGSLQCPGTGDISRYKCAHVSDPHAKRGFEDEARFIASLGDLDRGLSEEEDADRAQPSPVPDPPPSAAPPAPQFTADDDAARMSARTFMRFADREPHATRRLLNLFPESALEPPQASVEPSDTARHPPPEPRRAAATPPDALARQSTGPFDAADAHAGEPFGLSTDPQRQSRRTPHLRAGQEPPDLESFARGSRLLSALIVGVFALLLLAGAGGALWLWRDAVARTILEWEQIPIPPSGPARDLPMPIAPVPPPS
jgi:hypothetical protein